MADDSVEQAMIFARNEQQIRMDQRKEDETRHKELLEALGKVGDNTPEPPAPAPEPMEDPRYEGVFSSMLATFQDNLDFTRSTSAEELAERRRARAEKRREAVSAGEDKPSIRERLSDSVGGATDKVKGIELGGIAKFITKGLGIAILAPIITKFISGLVDGVIEDAFGEEAAEKYGGMIKVGGILAVIGGLLFGPLAILPLFFAGIMGVLGKKLVDGISDETLDKFGIDRKSLGGVVASVGAALGLFVPMLLKKAITGTAKLALKMVTGGAALAGNLVKSVVSGPAPGGRPGGAPGGRPGGVPQVRGGGVPSGMRVNNAGRMIHTNTGRFASADDIARAMQAEGRMAKVAKYMKFFKFAGPAMAIVPAIIDPLLAIYNDASENEIKKQLMGALGTVGGTALGGLAGAALGTGIFPGVGTAIGGFIGMGAGAFMGESLLERIADAVMSGDDIDEADIQKLSRKQRRDGVSISSASPSSVQVSSASSTSPGQKSALVKSRGGQGARAESKVAIMTEGTQAVLANSGGQINVAKGGNTSNQTNVGGSSTTFNIINNGSNSLKNSGHIPVSQSA